MFSYTMLHNKLMPAAAICRWESG